MQAKLKIIFVLTQRLKKLWNLSEEGANFQYVEI